MISRLVANRKIITMTIMMSVKEGQKDPLPSSESRLCGPSEVKALMVV